MEENVRDQNYTQNVEYPPAVVNNEQKKDEKNIFLLSHGKSLSSGEIHEKMCQSISKSRIQMDCLLVSSDVSTTQYLSSEPIVTSDEQKPADNPDAVSLLRRALNKLANSGEYNCLVEDIHVFVNVFNERDPEYKSLLGQQAILYNAEKQKTRGWK